MKNVKIMLTAIAVLAGVGGTLAFKANNMRSVPYCISKDNGTCTFTVMSKLGGNVFTFGTPLPAGVTKCTLANNGSGALCPLLIPLLNE